MKSETRKVGRPRAEKPDVVHLHVLIPRSLNEKIKSHGQKKTRLVIAALEKYLE
jgi:hypothetical protein